MEIPAIHIETLESPVRYTFAQIELASAVAQWLNRGVFWLCDPPRR